MRCRKKCGSCEIQGEEEGGESDQAGEMAMNEEKISLYAHDCFEYVERPRNKKVTPVHWTYSVKVDEHGNVIRYKAGQVAKACRHVQGIDVDEVFAPTGTC